MMVLNVRHTIVWLFMGSSLLVSNGVETDISCLKSIKDSMKDPFGNLESSWNFSNATEGFICKFTGVGCWHSDENRVFEIQLSGMGLSGEFPAGISKCTSVTGLNLSNNNLFGLIPPDISQMIPYATYLDLSSNNFSGEIPPDVANLSYLNVLKLDRNQFTGQIPPAFGLNQHLKTFSVSNNRLSGPVPNFVQVMVSVDSYANNSGLCGPPLTDCKGDSEDRVFFIIGFVVGWPVAAVSAFAVSWVYMPNIWAQKVMKWRRKKKKRKAIVKRPRRFKNLAFV